MLMPGIRTAGNIPGLLLQQQQMDLQRRRQKMDEQDAMIKNIMGMVGLGIGGAKAGTEIYTGLKQLGPDIALKQAQTTSIPFRDDLLKRGVGVDEGRLKVEQDRAGREERSFPTDQAYKEGMTRELAARAGKIETESQFIPEDMKSMFKLRGAQTTSIPFRDDLLKRGVGVDEGRLKVEQDRAGREERSFPTVHPRRHEIHVQAQGGPDLRNEPGPFH
jgi:hypothetical protein